ncbi:MAG: hypothetical protein WD231_01800 [Candidatus Woykebacteria bacterium]
MDETGQPVQNTANPNPKPVSWPRVLLTVLIIVLVVSILAGGYWYFVLNKPSETVDTSPIKVSTQSSKKATESSKKATSSAKKDETANWKVYEEKQLGFLIKYPGTWSIKAGTSGSVRVVKLNKDRESIEIYEDGGIEGGTDTTVELAVGSHKLEFWVFDSETNSQITYVNSSPRLESRTSSLLLFYIILDRKTHDQSLAEVKKILSTFKLLD